MKKEHGRAKKQKEPNRIKRPMKPTRRQKEVIESQGYNSKKYFVEMESDFYLYLKDRENGKRVKIDNYLIKNGGKR